MSNPGGNVADVAVAIPYDKDGETFLVLKRDDERDTYPGKWEFAAGFIEDDEEPRDAAIRELQEETGLQGTVLRSGEMHLVDAGSQMFRIYPFLVLLEDDDPEPDLGEEHQEWRWVTVHDARDLETVDGFIQDLQAVDIEV